MLLPQEQFAEQLWLQWASHHGVISLEFIKESLYKCNLKLRKEKTLQDIRLAFGRGFQNCNGNMELARQQIAEEIDKVCVIARWDFMNAKYKTV